MHPILFEIAGSPSTPTACCWPPPTCSACSSRWCARGSAASIRTGSWTSASGSSSARSPAPSCCCSSSNSIRSAANPTELLTLLRAGGVFYGGLIAAVAVALWYLRRHQMPMWTVTDVFAPGIALGHVIGRLGCFSPAAASAADRRAVGDHLPQRVRRAERRHAARRCRCIRRSCTRREPNC